MDDPTSVPAETLRAFCADVLAGLGASGETAALVADSLVDADLRGIESHGVHLLDLYATRIRAGQIQPTAEPVVARDFGSVVHLDGRLGFGQPCGVRAIDLGVERAREHGVVSVVARDATHLGALGYYTRRAATAGCVALAFQNGPTVVPPFGSRTPLFSTNPFSYAFPTGREPPIVYDGATTAVAGNRLLLAKRRRDPTIPPGWANDEEGRPTTDTERASVHRLQWSGGHKGYGIAFLVELMAGVAAGSSFGRSEHTESPVHGAERVAKGFQFVVIDGGRFMPIDELRIRADALVRDVHAADPAVGVDRVYVPGELEEIVYARRCTEGVPLAAPLVESLDALAAEVGAEYLFTRLRARKEPA